MNIFDLPGPEFLNFYLYAAVFCLAWAALLPLLLRFPWGMPADAGRDLHPFEIAYISGGQQAVWRTVLVALWQRGLVTPDAMIHSFKRTEQIPALDLHPAERTALVGIGSLTTFVGKIYNLDLGPAEILPKLLQRGLALQPLAREMLRVLRTLPLALLLAAGIIKIGVGLLRGRPVEYLVILCVLTVPAIIFFIRRMPYGTWRGYRVFRAMQSSRSALRFATRRKTVDQNSDEIVICAALFGVSSTTFGATMAVALMVPKPRRFEFTSGGDGGGGGGCGGGCGGGGGGGGCGGCGGGH